eukprot:CAMPEP_0172298416 /NCGR_PEP_ID=MMETSP1058-20130122/1086_1 /TAXON_ID=83371 /ORGANISM="Detonula confervacea, Strain CCMP 353" /LENGTH=881 /DNA_ID=CAMNT_0013007691 /DNA_START=25 /DNA_END=2670 /DNA_ORIENTATION=-
MDFSTVDRALTSLSRRHPPLPNEVLDLSNRLLELLPSADGLSENVEYAHGILRLIEFGGGTISDSDNDTTSAPLRWEPLAVGLRLVLDYLEKRTGELPAPSHNPLDNDDDDEDEGTGLGTGGGGVYAEGPRIPKIQESGSAAAAKKEELKNKVSCPPNAKSPVFELMMALPTIVNAHVEHCEPRVRSLVAQTVGAYALYATSLLNWLGSTSEESNNNNNEEREQLEQAAKKNQVGRKQIHSVILHSLKSHLEMKGPSRENNPGAASDGALDDTTGWRALETNLHALASYIDGCVGRAGSDGYRGGSYIEEEIRLFKPSKEDGDFDNWFLSGLQHCCVVHVNRHVRAASAAVLGVLVKACMRSSRDASSHRNLLVETDSAFRLVLKETLRGTLEDNWSQVRMAGSVLGRRFVLALLKIHSNNNSESEEDDEDDDEELTVFESAAGDLVPMLLPRMCLNRFYLAQGVKLYSQETWKLVFGIAHANSEEGLHSSGDQKGGGGMGAVARSAAPLCRFYSKMCDADNHAVREAACQGVAELAQKVGAHPSYAEYISPYVTMLLQALLMCFHDESWPVRDEACLACGTFCLAYAEECKPELATLFERWTEQLTDQIWSVREDAAVALGDAITAYGPDMLEKVLAVVRKGLPAARDQAPMSREEYKRLQNDVSAHTGNQVYSCGSLAPKLRKGGAGRIGCSSCVVDRPKAPWEATDGCVYLLRELCMRFANGDDTEREDVVMTDAILLPLMTELADVCRLSHYPQSDDLRTTLWRQMPPIAEALGKRRFKGLYLDLFIELLAKNLDDRCGTGASQLSIHAAGQCAEEIANLIGVGIFRGRVEATGREEAFDRVMEDRRREQHMAAANGRFGKEVFHSPFGPPVAGQVA